jgi:uncharacterized protein (DUF983 family)
VSRPFLPHADFGTPDCGGCLLGIIRAEKATIECNECGAVVHTVATADLQRMLDEMELSLEICTETCPHCGKVNIFPGFSEINAYICENCGRAVETGES